jgi:hypothetical protein
VVEAAGWPAASDATLVWLAPIVGPASVVMMHRLGSYAAEGSSVWEPAELGATFGLGVSMLARTIERLCRFGLVEVHPPGLAVRVSVGPLSQRWVAQLPAYLADAYRAETRQLPTLA